MKEIILKKIKEIEESHNIEVLYACESGSRAWGFASEDSDYDVRLVYKQKIDNYLSVVDTSDFIDMPIDEVWDFNAWDIKKVLILLIKSNTTVFEWLQSPIVYKEAEGVRVAMWALSHDYYCQQTHTHHYLGLAKKMLLEHTDEQVKYKTLFYILRALLSAKWNVEFNRIAPMEFKPLLKVVNDDKLTAYILLLIKEKEGLTEKDWYTWDARLKDYVYDLYESLSKATVVKSKGSFDNELVNRFFRKEVRQ
ncbi:nucleotidyltransferase domain-containing protein [Myroides odoratimimus]|uniref:nucleotidyltransferase domain-containing protein n=1 Tax=Myroides odoratimimus TaxID=76832 RepID=UPI001CE1E7ED|nr:nucleotidyltransferase domain-containing protein [Myroides odoratimimus]MCA4792986.1 nucleotidyltransferase domain-containing protein [Myroides odoratimimus]MCA4820143.1 nucleotidyltransferase domain-containing protein [Myroides odoratimimus]MCS7474399.1 nucleotidyltransferase domain-containing protein [Myroides odoratimimus]MDM1039213.1 nucleotidyltransferase domain-containing protein [Myroides odoratimimus]MDM1053391.1 nucleotidyltransferase domain-containing protein [Myroides odoratimimu